jgi:hypothetical protein
MVLYAQNRTRKSLGLQAVGTASENYICLEFSISRTAIRKLYATSPAGSRMIGRQDLDTCTGYCVAVRVINRPIDHSH